MNQQFSKPPEKTITRDLLRAIRGQFAINWNGIHGISHWARVYDIGMKLSATTGANPTIVQLFSVFHDSCRHGEGTDPQHGPRGAELASHYRSAHLHFLTGDEFEMLYAACRLHTCALTHEDITVQTCFDSDRLDLGRVGTIPDPQYLCTNAAKSKEMIAWALANSETGSIPDNVLGQFGLQN